MELKRVRLCGYATFTWGIRRVRPSAPYPALWSQIDHGETESWHLTVEWSTIFSTRTQQEIKLPRLMYTLLTTSNYRISTPSTTRRCFEQMLYLMALFMMSTNKKAPPLNAYIHRSARGWGGAGQKTRELPFKESPDMRFHWKSSNQEFPHWKSQNLNATVTISGRQAKCRICLEPESTSFRVLEIWTRLWKACHVWNIVCYDEKENGPNLNRLHGLHQLLTSLCRSETCNFEVPVYC